MQFLPQIGPLTLQHALQVIDGDAGSALASPGAEHLFQLLDIDRVDLAIPGYSTNMTAPFMPTAIERNLLVVSYFCLALNDRFHYPRYFSMVPFGPQPKISLSLLSSSIRPILSPRPP